MINNSTYSQSEFYLATKHKKSLAIAKPFKVILDVEIIEYNIDTDLLGTFSGEIERQDSPLDTARKKCLLSIKDLDAKFALASEGSFSPHPLVPFLSSDHEILYFIDRQNGFEIFLSEISLETNFNKQEIYDIDNLFEFAQKALFPSHGLILSSLDSNNQKCTFKGIQNKNDLEFAFQECLSHSYLKKVLVETDMRAHKNPTRMKIIENLGNKLARRLLERCPKCFTPGWGKTDIELGLPCESCQRPTNEIKSEVFTCRKCNHKEHLPPAHQKKHADQRLCPICNP